MKTVTGFRTLSVPLAMVVLLTVVRAEDAPLATMEPAQTAAAQRDRLDLDTTSVTGNQELPKVLYIVPWKDAEDGDLAGRPANSLLDEVLAPIDREVFQRQIRYFEQLHAADSGAKQTATEGK